MSPEEQARRARVLRRQAFQRQQDAALKGNDAAAATLRAQWEPMRQFIQEGPDVGERQEADADGKQRIN